jgi:hypothetical protein
MKTKNVDQTSDVRNLVVKNEKAFMDEYLSSYIGSIAQVRGTGRGEYTESMPDTLTLLRFYALDHILENFSLNELFMLFYKQPLYGLYKENLEETKQSAIENINADETLTPTEKNNLKRKVWNMHPIVFGLILQLVHKSNIFYDIENDTTIFPTFKVETIDL